MSRAQSPEKMLRLLFLISCAVVTLARASDDALCDGPWSHSVQLDYLTYEGRTAFYCAKPLALQLPEFPMEGLIAGQNGRVTTRFTVTEEGTIADLQLLSSTNPMFTQPVIDAIKRWKFAPVAHRQSGKPGIAHLIAAFRFSIIDQGEEDGEPARPDNAD